MNDRFRGIVENRKASNGHMRHVTKDDWDRIRLQFTDSDIELLNRVAGARLSNYVQIEIKPFPLVTID